MRRIKIDTTDVFLEDEGGGRGKITVSDVHRGAFTYYWGAMGSSLEEFLQKIDADYFAQKLCRTQFEFDAKKSVRNIRRYIRTELKDELPWWQFLEAQKELREHIKELEECRTSVEFVEACQRIPEEMIYLHLSHYEEREFKSIISSVFSDSPWDFIENVESREVKWLASLHAKIKQWLEEYTSVTI